jgi:hypothetical protein
VRAEEAIPQGEVLSVVAREVDVVVGVVERTVDDALQRLGHQVNAVVDRHRPQLHDDEHDEVHVLVKGEEKREEMIGQTLEKAVKRVEGMGGERGCDDPLMVRFVNVSIRKLDFMKAAMNEVDKHICEKEKKNDAEEKVGPPILIDGVIQHAVSVQLKHKKNCREESDKGYRLQCEQDLESDLVGEHSLVIHDRRIEENQVIETSKG